jgi:ribosomal protein L37E
MLKTDQDTDDAQPRREGDVTSALASHPPLTAADRCDRCGAQAYIRVTMPSGSELLFCAHHGHANEDRLRALAAKIQDDSSQLAGTPATAPETE